MVEIPVAGLARFLAPLLGLFGQKVFVFVEVSMGQERPYALTLLNRSSYRVLVESLVADPDGFPEFGNGWHLNESQLFQRKLLQPGQRIRLFFSPKEVGKLGQRQSYRAEA